MGQKFFKGWHNWLLALGIGQLGVFGPFEPGMNL